MQAKKEINLREGRIFNTVVRLAMPIMASSFVGLAYTLTDMFWVSGLGERAVAAVGTGGTLLWLVESLFSMPRVGGQVLMGQSIGAEENEEARAYARVALQTGYAMGLLFTLVFFFFAADLTSIFRFNDRETILQTECYLRIVALGMIPRVGAMLYNGFFTSSGNSFTPFVIFVAGLFANMAFDPLLIRTFSLGVAGAAWATVISQSLAFVLMLAAIRRNQWLFRLRLFRVRPKLSHLIAMLKLGVPVSVQSSIYALVTIIVSREIARFGDLAVAAQRLGGQIESITWMTSEGFCMAVNAFMAQNVGARLFRRMRRGYYIGLLLVFAVCLISTAVLFFFGEPIVGLFFADPEAVMHGTRYLHIISASQLMMGTQFLASAGYNALGQSLFPALIVAVCMVSRIPLSAALSATSLGVDGIWWALTLTSNLAGLILVASFPFYMRRFAKRETGNLMHPA